MNRNHFLIALIAIALVILGGAAWFVFYGGNSDSATAVAGGTTRSGFTLTAYDRTQGSPKAPLLVVEYAAPTCPHCAHFDMNIFPQFKKNWIDTGKAYYVFRVFPLNAVDVAAESIARCLPQDRYFPFIEMLFHNQPKWDPDGYDIPDVHGALIQMAQLAGLDAAKADACMNDQAAAKHTNDIAQDAQKNYLIDHTPTIFANGHTVDDSIESYEKFDAALKAAAQKK
ncbi:MAG TPA: thioredoxin domain-containing protein [Rhizomicrobium sp.]|nr:thioredoxin domain-containing protein [Rhizomicrobium sp.]